MGAFKFGRETYPNDYAELMMDEDLRSAFETYAEKTNILENVNFLSTEFEPKRDYERFIKQRAREQINITGALRKEMDRLDAEGNYDEKAWQLHVIAAKEEVRATINENHLAVKTDRFWKSAEFAALLKRNLGDPKKAAEKLGIKDANVELLLDLMLAAMIGDATLVDQYARDLWTKEQFAGSAEDLAKQVENLL